MVPDEVATPPSFGVGRKWRIGLNVLVSTCALMGVLVMANYLSARHFARFHWVSSAGVQLSPQTLRILGTVTNKVKVVIFFDKNNAIYGPVTELLEEYKLRCRHLDVEVVDYLHSPSRAVKVRDQYKLAPVEAGDLVIFESNGAVQVVYARDLSVYDQGALLRGDEIKRTAFKGEQLFSSAIYAFTDSRPVKAYFLLGHSEHDPTAQNNEGYLLFKQLLEEGRVTTERLTSLPFEDIPADCQLLIIAGAQTPLKRQELDRVEKYLNRGGRLFVLFNFQTQEAGRRTGLEALLERWGVAVGQNIVRDRAHSKVGEADELLLSDFHDHPVVAPLMRSTLSLAVPRSIARRSTGTQVADSTKVTELVFSSKEGVALAGLAQKTPLQTGQIPVIAAVEKGAIQGIGADRGATRIVVTGDSFFLSNGWIGEGANRDFGRNAVQWLLSRDLLLEGISAQPVNEYRISLTEGEMKTARWLLLGGFPGGVLFLGFLVWLRRRH